MLPTLFKIGPIALHSYGLMIAIGFLVSLHFMRRDAEKAGIDPQRITDLAFGSLILGLIATRVMHIIEYPSAYSWNDPVGWIAIWRGGLVFQGAVPAVVLYAWYKLRKWKISFWLTADAIMPYVPLGHAFGRLGCFLNGCCYGQRSDMPWAMPFRRVPWDLSKPPTGSPAYLDHCQRYAELSFNVNHWSYPVHPTQLYSAALLFGICLLMLALRKKWHPFRGFLLPAYFVLYGVKRFTVEAFRGDHNPTHFGARLSDQQVICLIFILFGAVLFFVVGRYARARATDAQRKQ